MRQRNGVQKETVIFSEFTVNGMFFLLTWWEGPLPKPDLCRETITHYRDLHSYPSQLLPAQSLPRYLHRHPKDHWIRQTLDCCEKITTTTTKSNVRGQGFRGLTIPERFPFIRVGRGLVELSSPPLEAREGRVCTHCPLPPFNYNWVLRQREGATHTP